MAKQKNKAKEDAAVVFEAPAPEDLEPEEPNIPKINKWAILDKKLRSNKAEAWYVFFGIFSLSANLSFLQNDMESDEFIFFYDGDGQSSTKLREYAWLLMNINVWVFLVGKTHQGIVNFKAHKAGVREDYHVQEHLQVLRMVYNAVLFWTAEVAFILFGFIVNNYMRTTGGSGSSNANLLAGFVGFFTTLFKTVVVANSMFSALEILSATAVANDRTLIHLFCNCCLPPLVLLRVMCALGFAFNKMRTDNDKDALLVSQGCHQWICWCCMRKKSNRLERKYKPRSTRSKLRGPPNFAKISVRGKRNSKGVVTFV
jgi:hypothetical protein